MASDITWFNALAVMDAQRALSRVCAAPAFVNGVLSSRPYVDDSALFSRVTRVLARLPETEVEVALTRQSGPAATMGSVSVSDPAIRMALIRGYAAYEAKFGVPCLIRRADRSDAELLAAVQARLENNAETEREIIRAELTNVTKNRLVDLLTNNRTHS